mmetsp:Transcript_70643/g.229491  ORF Transcript_70643/g.229491 Transcript_70643/m.229491 type:complete len:469 (-) Transcript_70643:223-1629(-)|eukprot:CAMPEP_0203895914 /NCGR_PEP_ID=MMETSP0359-20131031/38708_1 /ASSEMBLY_ACC=CAM_ASM_000338 /TAXON_ID=268821 /ORGANISM="Scrippsiella Hangoei, Strain SHTV-5" /LENGTH=468 /DNA_ID=CAMNT_0050818479 /DNA_START=57 /DNA_END=1463 /DNA_ORIENTATION=-
MKVVLRVPLVLAFLARGVVGGIIFVHQMPECGGERLLSYDSTYKGDRRREQFFVASEWAIELIRSLHTKAMLEGGAEESVVELFYIPCFFALLLALHDTASLECLARASATLVASPIFRRNAGYDHFYLHGFEHPVVTEFDYALATSRPAHLASSKLANTFYATVQNVAVIATGDLAQGTIAAALSGSLYGMRRVITVPFPFRRPCKSPTDEEFEPRTSRLVFVGSIQSYNFERTLFLRAVVSEFESQVRVRAGNLFFLDCSAMQLRARVRLNPHLTPLNASERASVGIHTGMFWRLYRTSELCVVAPGDAPVLGQRLSDALVAGCVPVVLISPGTYPVLPLQGSIRWEEFIIIVRVGDDVTTARWALRRLLATSRSEIARRRAAMLRWRPQLVIGSRASKRACRDPLRDEDGPDVGDLVIEELKSVQRIWQRVLPSGSLELNSSECAHASLSSPRCAMLHGLLPAWS